MNLGIFSYRFRLLEQLGIHFRGFELIKTPLNVHLMRCNDNQNTEYNACYCCTKLLAIVVHNVIQ